jgi:hypothetical protein
MAAQFRYLTLIPKKEALSPSLPRILDQLVLYTVLLNW